MSMIALKPASSAIARRAVRSEAVALPTRARRALRTRALLGPDGKPGTTGGTKGSNGIKREAEPEKYWNSKYEDNPMKDPMAIIGVLGILFPFIFLGIAIGAGFIDVSVYR